nr:hypothetical protein [Halapricum hydrolyticum]
MLTSLRAVPDPEHHASVSVDDVVRSNADDFLTAKSTADGQPKRDVSDRVVGRVEELVNFVLGESHLLSVLVGVVVEVHVRNVTLTGQKGPK